MVLPFPNSYHVPGSRLIAGEYPFAPDPSLGRVKVRQCLNAGIRSFVDLTQVKERYTDLLPYEAVLREEAAEMGIQVSYCRIGIVDYSVPSRDQALDALQAIEDGERDRPNVYVHCWGGIGRTGTIVGCYLLRRGMDPEEALAEVARLHAGTGRLVSHPRSPQNDEQCDFVRCFR